MWADAGAFLIRPFEGSRPGFGRAIAYWVFNRERDTPLGNVATSALTDRLAAVLSGHIAIALTNRSTRKRPPLCGFVQTHEPPKPAVGFGRIIAVPDRGPSVDRTRRSDSPSSASSARYRWVPQDVARHPRAPFAYFTKCLMSFSFSSMILSSKSVSSLIV
jgi:hypothetical protein